jgi:hypothetical protein
MPTRAEWVQSLVKAIHCPSCGEKAAHQFLQFSETLGVYAVLPHYCCDTEDCDYNLEGPKFWTIVLRD